MGVTSITVSQRLAICIYNIQLYATLKGSLYAETSSKRGLLDALRSLLHLEPEKIGFGAAHYRRLIAVPLVEKIAALIEGINLRS